MPGTAVTLPSRRRRGPSAARGLGESAVLAVLAVLAFAEGGTGQLLSPGPLTSPHASLEGLRNCTSCHELGRKGAADSRCRSCHTVLDDRIEADRGWHASVKSQACAECHKEHLGRSFALVRLDSATFEHARTGYRLDGAHREARCRDCHRSDRVRSPEVIEWAREHDVLGRTMLGLDSSCRSCHAEDDAHGRQFAGRECETCHATGEWEKAERFDHDKTKYRLVGEHRQASCDGCHPTEGSGERAIVRYSDIRTGTCGACHEDTHKGAMGAACASCHDPRGWNSLDRTRVASRFDHGRTHFPLRGRHAAADCASCHSRPRRTGDPVRIRLVAGTERASFPQPRAEACADCHVDAHDGELAAREDRGACESCHGEHGWMPASFGVERHDAETGFALAGAHRVTFCSGCHASPAAGTNGPQLSFATAAGDCASCHRKDDPHEGRYGERPCETCHATASFTDARFDHTASATTACSSCHQPDDPHASQFGETGCESCHTTTSFAIPGFDHDRTRFRLDGKHAGVACSGCHAPEPGKDGAGIIRYRPLRTECTACHGSAS